MPCVGWDQARCRSCRSSLAAAGLSARCGHDLPLSLHPLQGFFVDPPLDDGAGQIAFLLAQILAPDHGEEVSLLHCVPDTQPARFRPPCGFSHLSYLAGEATTYRDQAV